MAASNRQGGWVDIKGECRFDVHCKGPLEHPTYEVTITHVRTGLKVFARTDMCKPTLGQVCRAAQDELLTQLDALSVESYGGSG